MGVCRLCLEERELVKAHIVPEAFFRVLREGGEIPFLITNSAGMYSKRSPIGVYDKSILCRDCETRFSRVDGYGTDIFLKKFEEVFQPINHYGTTVGFEAHNIDQDLLLRFLIATLWRASVSTQPYYGRVCLGPYEAEAAKAILVPEEPVSQIFAAVLSCWTAEDEQAYFHRALMNPFREKWKGVNAYRFYYGQVVAYIKVSNQAVPAPFKKFTLTEQPILGVMARDFARSKDFSSMVHLVNTSRDRK